MSEGLEFNRSEPLTLGVELELQLLTTRDYDLTRGAVHLLHSMNYHRLQSMFLYHKK